MPLFFFALVLGHASGLRYDIRVKLCAACNNNVQNGAKMMVNKPADLRGRIWSWPGTQDERILSQKKLLTRGSTRRLLLTRMAVIVAFASELYVGLRSFWVSSDEDGASALGVNSNYVTDDALSTSGSPTEFLDGEDGDAVTSPALELKLEELLASQSSPERQEEVERLVRALEAREGAQLFASAGIGRWVIPWVGGWQQLATNSPDARFFGGPASDKLLVAATDARPLLKIGDVVFNQESVRTFVYGPGVGGVTMEFLYSAPGVASKLLITRNGTVSNQGGNFFTIDYKYAPEGYPVIKGEKEDLLGSNSPLPELDTPIGLPAQQASKVARPRTTTVQVPSESAAIGVLASKQGTSGQLNQLLGLPTMLSELRTTYLSATMWIVRCDDDDDKNEADRFVVWQRTETRSVMDRRGLVAEGQLKPSNDESIRYGRLLFGESLSDYGGWESASNLDKGGTDKLIR